MQIRVWGDLRRFFLIFCFLLTLLHSIPIQALPGDWTAEDFGGFPVEAKIGLAPDGTLLRLAHLPNPEARALILMEPGILGTARYYRYLATAARQRGFEVLIGQVRLAGLGQTASEAGARNGLEEAVLLDFPTHLRLAIELAHQRGIRLHLIVHSMGGMLTLAAATLLGPEALNEVDRVTFLQVPHRFDRLPNYMRVAAPGILRLLRWLHARGVRTIDPHHLPMDFVHWLERHRLPLMGGELPFARRRVAQVSALALNRLILEQQHHTLDELYDFLAHNVGPLPIELLIEMTLSAIQGAPFTREGDLMIRPERFYRSARVVAAENDPLAPWQDNMELYHQLGSSRREFVLMAQTNHICCVAGGRLAGESFSESLSDRVLAYHELAEAPETPAGDSILWTPESVVVSTPSNATTASCRTAMRLRESRGPLPEPFQSSWNASARARSPTRR